MVNEILVLFDQAVSHGKSFAALRLELEKAPTLARYLRLLAADQGKVDDEAATSLSISVAELRGLQAEALRVLRQAIGAP